MSFKDYIKDGQLFEIDVSSFGNLNEPDYIKKYNGYLFYVNDIEFLFKGNHIGQNEWIIKFGVHENNGEIDISMTNKQEIKNTILILKNVIQCISLFTKKYKPNKLTFIVETKSRQKMYKRMCHNLIMKPDWQYYGDMKTKESEVNGSITWIITKRGYNEI